MASARCNRDFAGFLGRYVACCVLWVALNNVGFTGISRGSTTSATFRTCMVADTPRPAPPRPAGPTSLRKPEDTVRPLACRTPRAALPDAAQTTTTSSTGGTRRGTRTGRTSCSAASRSSSSATFGIPPRRGPNAKPGACPLFVVCLRPNGVAVRRARLAQPGVRRRRAALAGRAAAGTAISSRSSEAKISSLKKFANGLPPPPPPCCGCTALRRCGRSRRHRDGLRRCRTHLHKGAWGTLRVLRLGTPLGVLRLGTLRVLRLGTLRVLLGYS